MASKLSIHGFCAAWVVLSMLAIGMQARADETPTGVTLTLDPKTPLPTSPGYSVVKAKAVYNKKEIPVAFGVFLPANYFSANKPYPLIVALHNSIDSIGGADGNPGMVGEGMAMLFTHDVGADNRHSGVMPAKPVNVRKNAFFMGLVPQCVKGLGFDSPEMVHIILEEINVIGKSFRMDQDRVAVTGFSYGGFSTWALAMAAPERFAAIIPVEARMAPTPEKAPERLKHVGIWIGVGDSDGDFTANCNQMNDLLKKGGHSNVQLTVVKGGQHHCYQAIYSDPKFWEWFYQQHRSKQTASK